MSRALSRFQAVLLGLVIVTGLGLAGGGLFAVGSRQMLWSDAFHLQVGFQQVRGVDVGTRVRVQGINAGDVVRVEYPATPGGDVILHLRLDGRLRQLVRADAFAEIANEGLIGGKVVEIQPGTSAADVVRDGAAIASRPTLEVAQVLQQADTVLGHASHVLEGVKKGEGSLGKLAKDGAAYAELVALMKEGQGTLASIRQDANAIRDLPIIRGYVKDAHKLMVRPECERHRRWFAATELFEPDQATLTAAGRQKLDQLAPWVNGLKHSGSEVVVASFANGMAAPLAETLTQKQSEAVATYLVDQHAIHKLGWFSRRTVTPLGLGLNPSPQPDKEPLPAPRIEVLVFVPQS